MQLAMKVVESWMCGFVPPRPSSAEYLAELSGVVALTGDHAVENESCFERENGASSPDLGTGRASSKFL